MKFFYLLLIFSVAAYAEKARFDNYRVYRVLLENDEQVLAMRELSESSDSVNKWFNMNELIN